MLDRYNKGSVTAHELIDVLNDLGLMAHKDDVYLFVRRYDRDSDGRVQYSDFCGAFTPKTFHHASALNNRRAYY
jgi:Ca2+-binding EF-hand superfamily protein